MANETDFADLLKQSSRVFELARSLSTAFGFFKANLDKGITKQSATQEFDRRTKTFVVADIESVLTNLPKSQEDLENVALFEEKGVSLRDIVEQQQLDFYNRIITLRTAIITPPIGFEPVADHLRRAAKTAKHVRDFGRKEIYHNLIDELSSIGIEGGREVAILQFLTAPPDPLGFVDELELANLKKYPPSFKGHFNYIEFVMDKLGKIVALKNLGNSISRRRINALKNEWREARQRADYLESIPDGLRARLRMALHIDLNETSLGPAHEWLTEAIDAISSWRQKVQASSSLVNEINPQGVTPQPEDKQANSVKDNWLECPTKTWARKLDVSEQTVRSWARAKKEFIIKVKAGAFKINLNHPFISCKGWKQATPKK